MGMKFVIRIKAVKDDGTVIGTAKGVTEDLEVTASVMQWVYENMVKLNTGAIFSQGVDHNETSH